jgi:hypothetical protein
MENSLFGAREKVAWFKAQEREGIADYHRDRSAYFAQLRDAFDWLCAHPKEAVTAIGEVHLGKFSGGLVDVLGRIGSPAADPCAAKVAALLVDQNWPVALPARESLFMHFSKQAILGAATELLRERLVEEFDMLCYEVFYRKREWFPYLIPLIEQALRDPAIDKSWLELSAECRQQVDDTHDSV